MGQILSTEPATGATLWEGETSDVDQEVAVARDAWADWAARPLTVRVETLRRFANGLRGELDSIADLMARETGRPPWDAHASVEAVVARVEGAIGAYADRTAQRKMEGALSTRVAVRHKPHGVLAVITPFSAPLEAPAGQVIPALLAGNAVLLKPSEKTSACGLAFVRLLHAAGVPEPVLRIVLGGPDEGARLAAHADVDGVLFTGSAKVGLALHRQFADTPHRLLTLALGGNNPVVVWDTPDVHGAALAVVQSAYLSSGQLCTAARRLIVREGGHEPLVEEIAKLIDRLIVGGPQDKPVPYLGPLIDNMAADHVEERALDLVLKGGRPIRRLDRPDAARPFLRPALIDVTGIVNRPDEEIFGPVLQLVRVADFDEALQEANATRYGLVAALIGGAPALYDRFWASVRAGAIHWNRPTTAMPANAPLGGTSLSGNHRPGGSYAADQCVYPVTSWEAEQTRLSIGIGLSDG